MTARLVADRSGVTIVEFAILLPLFLILIFGIVQFAQVIFFQVALQHAVTGAARCASEFAGANALGAGNTPPDCSTSDRVKTMAQQQAFGLAVPAGTFTPSTSATSTCVGASYSFALAIPLISRTIALTAQSCYPVAPPAS
jgi:Flp pilus assembly protein TadG